MTDQDLCEWIRVGEERRNLEYKRPMRWDDENTRATITKVVLAMSNIRDGGWMVIGIEEGNPKGTFRRVGLTQEQANTFNVDSISSHVNEYADPYVVLHVYKPTCDGKQYVMIKVDEFEELPVVCKKDNPIAKVRQGGIYTRSLRKNESCQVLSQSEMREIIDLAVDKNTRKFFERLKRTGLASVSISSIDEEAFDSQLGELR